MNCGDPTPGQYCPTCGQRKVDVQVSVRVMLADVLEDQFIVDRRTPRTLWALLFEPGLLSVQYVNGRIASYVRPFRLYLVSSVVFFLLLSFIGLNLVRGAMTEPGEQAAPPAADSVRLDSLDVEVARLDSALATMRAQVADTALPAGVAAAMGLAEAQIERQRTRAIVLRDSIRQAVAAAPRAPDAPAGPGGEPAPADLTGTAAPGGTADTTDTSDPAQDTASAGETGAGPGAEDEDGPWVQIDHDHLNTGIPALDTILVTRVNRLGRMERRDAIETVLSGFFNYVPTVMFVLLPVFALVLKLLYIRRRRFYAEHFVFLLHVHSFVYILATLMLLLRRVVPGWIELALFGWILVYILLALKRVYGQGWLITLIKYWTLGWLYFWILLLTVPVAVVASLLLF